MKVGQPWITNLQMMWTAKCMGNIHKAYKNVLQTTPSPVPIMPVTIY